MALVPEGTFIMGWDAEEADDRPPYPVFLGAFHIYHYM